MRKKRVILYDDESSILNLLRIFFTRRDYEVMAFEEPVICPVYTKNDGVCLSDKSCADIILTDFQMQQMNGFDLLESQRQHGCQLDIRHKAIMSGGMPAEYRRKIADLGYEFFTKPFDFIKLAAWLDACEARMDLTLPLGVERKEARRPVLQEITYYPHNHGNPCQGTIINFSDTGACLKADNPLVSRQALTFQPELPNAYQTAIVRWASQVTETGYLAGLSCI